MTRCYLKAQCYAENKLRILKWKIKKNQNRLNKYLYPSSQDNRIKCLPVWEIQSTRTETNELNVQHIIISVIKKLESLHNDKVSGPSILCIEEK